jgi:hypothetical protein
MVSVANSAELPGGVGERWGICSQRQRRAEKLAQRETGVPGTPVFGRAGADQRWVNVKKEQSAVGRDTGAPTARRFCARWGGGTYQTFTNVL